MDGTLAPAIATATAKSAAQVPGPKASSEKLCTKTWADKNVELFIKRNYDRRTF